AHQQLVENKFQVEGRKKLSEEEIRQKILKDTDKIEPRRIGTLEKTERDRILQKLKKSGLSIREIERATGISRGIVAKS
ncbi:MAG: Transposase like protein, partial [Caproiciproducens sp.]|nr:Transposase like protein [Caproiciproducens sp.]